MTKLFPRYILIGSTDWDIKRPRRTHIILKSTAAELKKLQDHVPTNEEEQPKQTDTESVIPEATGKIDTEYNKLKQTETKVWGIVNTAVTTVEGITVE